MLRCIQVLQMPCKAHTEEMNHVLHVFFSVIACCACAPVNISPTHMRFCGYGKVQDAQAELQRNTHLCAVLRAHAAALSQQVKHYTQLQDKAHVDNASLHEQLAAVAAAWDEERHKVHNENLQSSCGSCCKSVPAACTCWKV